MAGSKSSPTPIPAGWLAIGTIVSAQGLGGEVRVYPDSDFPERFEDPGQRWLLPPNATSPQPIELLKGRYIDGKGLYVLQLKGITSRDQAETLRGSRLLVEEGDRLPLEEGEFHVLDLIGLQVWNQTTQEQVGVVTDVLSAGNDLLEVELANTTRKVLIPFVEPIVPEVNLEQGRIEITPPPGLID